MREAGFSDGEIAGARRRRRTDRVRSVDLNPSPEGDAYRSAQRQNLLRRAQMRLVDHLAVDLHDAGCRIVVEGLDHLLRPGDFLIRRHEGGIDDVDMLGMDHGLGQETILPRGDRLFP